MRAYRRDRCLPAPATAQGIHRRPGPDLPVPALPATRLARRPRPHDPLRRRRTNLPLQPRRPLPHPPHPQAPPRLEPPPDRPRHLRLDHPGRPHLHHQPRHPCRLGSPAECPGTGQEAAARRAASKSRQATAREREQPGQAGREGGGRGQRAGEGDGRQPGHEEQPISQPGMSATAKGGHSSWAGITRQCHGRSSNGGCPGATPAAAPQAIPAQTAPAQTAPPQATRAQQPRPRRPRPRQPRPRQPRPRQPGRQQ